MTNFHFVEGKGVGTSKCNKCDRVIPKGRRRLRFLHGSGSYKVQADICLECLREEVNKALNDGLLEYMNGT